MKQIRIDNVTYKSFAAAWRQLSIDSVSFALARKRIQRGWKPKLAFRIPPIQAQERRTSGFNSV